MKKQFPKILLATCSLACLLIPTFASAEDTSNNGQALEISPPVVTLMADPGQTITTQISLRNVSSGTLLVSGEINDFTADGETGNPKVIIDGEQSANSIRSWVSDFSQITLASKKLANFPVTISVPQDAAPGGYFGVVRFTPTAPELDETGVSLSASIGSLIFIKVSGVADEKLSIDSFTTESNSETKKLFESTPINFVVKFKNEGNMYEQPVGKIVIKDMFKNDIAAVNVNLAKSNVLPGSTRVFEQKLDSSVIGDKKLFGRYTATLTAVYGDENKAVTSEITFWVIPYKLIAIIVAALIIIFFVLKTLLKQYNKAITKKAIANHEKSKKSKKTKK